MKALNLNAPTEAPGVRDALSNMSKLASIGADNLHEFAHPMLQNALSAGNMGLANAGSLRNLGDKASSEYATLIDPNSSLITTAAARAQATARQANTANLNQLMLRDQARGVTAGSGAYTNPATAALMAGNEAGASTGAAQGQFATNLGLAANQGTIATGAYGGASTSAANGVNAQANGLNSVSSAYNTLGGLNNQLGTLGLSTYNSDPKLAALGIGNAIYGYKNGLRPATTNVTNNYGTPGTAQPPQAGGTPATTGPTNPGAQPPLPVIPDLSAIQNGPDPFGPTSPAGPDPFGPTGP